jgi:hypothetical protein
MEVNILSKSCCYYLLCDVIKWEVHFSSLMLFPKNSNLNLTRIEQTIQNWWNFYRWIYTLKQLLRKGLGSKKKKQRNLLTLKEAKETRRLNTIWYPQLDPVTERGWVENWWNPKQVSSLVCNIKSMMICWFW